MKALRQRPAAPSRWASALSAASGVPPWSRQHSSARSIQGPTGWSPDSKASTMTAKLPSPAPVLCASAASSTRQFEREAARTGRSPARPRRGEEVPEADGAAGAEARPVLEAHPGLGDDAENALGADEEPVRTGPRARAGEAPRLEAALGRHDDEAFDEIVDMGVERGEMAAGASGDPAAEGRILEALREMAERQSRAASAAPRAPVRRRRPRCGRRARRGRRSSTRPIRARSTVQRGLVARGIDAMLDARPPRSSRRRRE